METLIWMFLVVALLVAGFWTAVQSRSAWKGAVWWLVAFALIAVALIGPFGETTEAVAR